MWSPARGASRLLRALRPGQRARIPAPWPRRALASSGAQLGSAPSDPQTPAHVFHENATSWVDPFDMDMDQMEGSDGEEGTADLQDLVARVAPDSQPELAAALTSLGVRSPEDLRRLAEADLLGRGIEILTARELLSAARAIAAEVGAASG